MAIENADGGIVIEFNADVSDAEKDLKALTKLIEDAQKKLNDAGKEGKLASELEEAKKEAGELYAKASKALSGVDSEKFSEEVENLRSRMESLNSSMQESNTILSEKRKVEATQYVDEYAESLTKASYSQNEMRQAIEQLEAELNSLQEQGLWFGDEDYDKKYQEYMRVLNDAKQYQKELMEPDVPENPFGLDTISGKVREAEIALSRLREQGKGIGDAEYDKQYRELALLRAEQKRYTDELSRTPEQAEKQASALRKAEEKAAALAQKEAEAAAEAEKLKSIRENAEISDESIAKLTDELAQLKARLAELDKAGVSLGYEEYDRTVARIQDINKELKEYKTNLTQAEDPENIPEPVSVRDFGERIRNIMSSLRGVFSSTAGTAVKTFGNALKAVGNTVKKTFSAGVKYAGNFAKGVLNAAKRMNVFSKLTSSLGPKLQRLSTMIKQAFVFNVISKGLRYLREQLGSYLKTNTELMTALGRLKGVFLTAFQPIYDTVVPALTTLIEGLTKAATVAVQFTSSLFGTTAKEAQKNAEALYNESKALEETGEAAEDAAGSLAGFDEINTIQTETAEKNSESAAENGGPLFDYEYEDTAFDSWGEMFDAFLTKILDEGIPKLKEGLSKLADWVNGFSKKLYDAFTFPGVADKMSRLGKEIADALNGLVSQINWDSIGRALGAGLNLALQFLVGFIYQFNWMALGASFAQALNGLLDEVDWYAFGQLLWGGFKIAIETLAGLLMELDYSKIGEAFNNIALGFLDGMNETLEKLDGFGEAMGEKLNTLVQTIKWAEIGQALGKAFGGALSEIVAFVNTFNWQELGASIAQFINNAIKEVNWKEFGEFLWSGFKIAIETLAGFIQELDMAELAQSASDIIIGLFDAMTETLASIDWFSIGHQLKEFLVNIDWAGIADSVFTTMGAAFAAVIEVLWGFIHDAWESLVEWWKDVAFEDGKFTITGLLEGIWDVMKNIGTWIKEHIFDPFVNGFKKVFQIHSPSEVMKELGVFIMQGLLGGIASLVQSVVDKFSELWDTIKNWYNGNIKQYFTADYWKKIGTDAINGLLNGLKNAWNSVSSWLSSAVSAVKSAWDSVVGFFSGSSSSSSSSSRHSSPYSSYSIYSPERLVQIPPITNFQIPGLATGAVIPPRREFLARLGDNQTETEIVSPLSTMKQAFMEALQESGGVGGDIHVTVELDGRVVARNTVKHVNDMTRAAGKPVLLF